MPPMDAEKNLRVLIVGGDPSLEDECRSALGGLPDTKSVLHFAETYRQAVEVARGRLPNLILIDIDRDAGEVSSLARELQELLPATPIAGAFKEERFEHASAGAAFIELLRADVRDFIRRPLSATELRAVLERLFAQSIGGSRPDHGRVVAFFSNKGGAGRSALAVNVACALALRYPDEVLLVDASPQGGTCAMMLDMKATSSMVDAVRERDRLDTTLLRHLTLKHDTGLRVLPAPADALEGADVDDEAIARVLDLARRAFRYVVVDTSPAIDGVATTILDMTDMALIVVPGTAPGVAAVARLLPVLEGLGLAPTRQRLVLNYNYKTFLGDLRPGDIADRLRRTVDYVVPYEKGVLVSMNTGSPHILHASWWQPFKRAITQVVDDLDAAVEAGARAARAERTAPLRAASDREVTL